MFGISKLQLYGMMAAAFALGLLGIYSAGIARGQDKIKRKLDAKLIDGLRQRQEISDELNQMDDTSLADRASEFVRDDKG
tara:strand:+ start:585 stop:824 length:240 start_codon:yes stop_codon:yes gene_type:complete